jgi:hypothetical protein
MAKFDDFTQQLFSNFVLRVNGRNDVRYGYKLSESPTLDL